MSRMISHQKVIGWCYYLLLITVCSMQARVGDSEHPFQRSLRKDKYVKNYIGDRDSLFRNYSICPKSWWLERFSVRNDRKAIGGIPLLWCSPQSEEQVRNLPASRTATFPTFYSLKTHSVCQLLPCHHPLLSHPLPTTPPDSIAPVTAHISQKNKWVTCFTEELPNSLVLHLQGILPWS